jgi:microsomal dipeptidase-like Zn-dependent dipeptidase
MKKGFADIHAHPMAHLAFGGHLIWGSPIGAFADALKPCNGTDHNANSRMHFINVAKRVLDGIAHEREASLAWSGRASPHADHPRDGYPEFHGWPSARAMMHQQMHVAWLRRAYEGGLRLMCALAVNNRLLGWLMENGTECWDDESIRAQVLAMRRVAESPENRSWMEIAYCAGDAERIIHSDKLAVVLGAEVDQIELFLGHDPFRLAMLEDEGRRYLRGEHRCAPNIEALAQTIYDVGLRQVTPLHFMDNSFGGAALYSDHVSTNIHWLNLWREGRATSDSGWPSVVAGPSEIERRLQRVQLSINRSWSICHPPLESSAVRYHDSLPNHVNARGLTDAGRVLLLNLWRRGILVDIDHMSLKTKEAVLSFAEQLGVPVVSSHCSIREITLDRAEIGLPDNWWSKWDGENPSAQPVWPALRHEGMRSDHDLLRIARLGGIAAPLLRQPAVRKPKELRNALSDGPELMGTITAAAAAYLHVVSVLGSKASVAIGSDVNGLAQLPTPSRCCPSATSNLYGMSGLPRATTGQRIWDVNADGVAHYGMLPDLLWRWRAEGMRETSLAPLFRSAEGYVETWTCAETAARRVCHANRSAKVS